MPYPAIVGSNVKTAWFWPEVSILRAATDGDRVTVDHTMAGRWPRITPDEVTIEANPWIVAKVNGVWLAATWEWLKPGQVSKTIPASDYAAKIKAPEFVGWTPRYGEVVGYMVSTPARGSVRTIDERSNVSWIQYGTSIEVPCPIPDWPGPPPPDPDPPPPDDLEARVAALEADVARLTVRLRQAGEILAGV